MLYPKSAILGLSFLDPKDLCLPNQFSRGSLQKRSVSSYKLNLMSEKKLGSFNDWINTYFQYFTCLPHDMNIFWLVSFVTFPWRCWTEFSHSRKGLRKALRIQENIWSVADLSGVTIGFYSNSRDRYFECSWRQKSIH